MILLEVTIAMALVALGSLMALSCLMKTMQVDVATEERVVALRAAVSDMEKVLAVDWEGRRGPRSLSMEGTVTEVVR